MGERNEVTSSTNFWKDVDKLPPKAQEKFAGLLEILASNPFDSRLHTKQLSTPLNGKYSFRITRDWRVVFMFADHHIIKLLIAGSRNDIYRRLKRMI